MTIEIYKEKLQLLLDVYPNYETFNNAIMLKYKDIIQALYSGNSIYIWGAGKLGHKVANAFLSKGIVKFSFIDKTELNVGSRIIHPSKVNFSSNDIVIVASSTYLPQISYEAAQKNATNILPYYILQLFDFELDLKTDDIVGAEYFLGLAEDFYNNMDDYYQLINVLCDEQSKKSVLLHLLFRITQDSDYLHKINSKNTIYFDSDIVKLSDHETVLDLGGYDGDTLRDFYHLSHASFRRYYLVEPIKNLFYKAQSCINDERIIYLNKWAYHCNTKRAFAADYSELSEDFFSVDLEIEESISFIKLDIEGGEMDALVGACMHIQTAKPTLAVSVYHKPDDFISLWKYLVKLVPDYQFYFRGYTGCVSDLVLYAIKIRNEEM